MGQRKNSTRVLLAAAVAVVGLGWILPGSAAAQYRVGSDGRSLDANNRIGSGGNNSGPDQSNNKVTAEDIFMGNVTGYGNFHGAVPVRNPDAFTGREPFLPSLVLQRQAGGTSPVSAPTYGIPTKFYDVNTAPTSLNGLTSVAGTGTYIVTPPPTQSPQDYRLGVNIDAPVVALPHPGEGGVGQVDPTASTTPSFLNNAPIYTASELPAAAYGYSNGTVGNVSGGNVSGQTTLTSSTALSDLDILKLRGEMIQNVRVQEGLQADAAALAKVSPVNGASGAGQANPGEVVNPPIIGPISGSTPLTIGNVPSATFSPPGVPVEPSHAPVNTGSTGQSMRYSLDPLPLPGEQSPQYAKLQGLLNQYNQSHPQTDEEANRQFQEALKARRAYEESQVHQPVPALAAPHTLAPAPQNPVNINPALPPPAPLDVGPISQTIRGEGLSKLIAGAEDSARHQQFKDAIGKFLDARRVAPNNMLIVVDLANAELGAGFYAQSEEYLRMAYAADPALLMGKYDLRGLLGDDRMQILITDLKRVASTSDSATPVFLLAYVSYDMGETDKALAFLQLAQTRAGGQDELLMSLQQHWLLPSTQPSK
jgi:tetratricopeptide (TPR) repeat protein